MKMLEAYSMFEQWHKYKGSRSSTMETYSYIVKRMFIEQFIGNIDTQDLTVIQCMNYVIHVREHKDVTDNTIASYWTKIRVFLNYLYENGFSDIDFQRKLKKFKTYKTKKMIYHDDEIIAIFNSIQGKSATSWQKRLIFMLFVDTGIRCGELLNLRLGDITMQGGPYVKIRGSKGYEDRILALSYTTYKVYQIYITFRKDSSSDYLFINKFGEPLTYHTIKSYIKTHIKLIGINRGNAHLFRHTTITKWLLKGNSTMLVMMWAGHKKSDTTENYFHYSNELKATGFDFVENNLLLSMIPLPRMHVNGRERTRQ